MGREVRRVPANWEHPRRECPHGMCDEAKEHQGKCFRPIHDADFETVARAWLDNAIAWDNGTHPDAKYKAEHPFYWQWAGDPPDENYYRPKWKDEERTHYQMYETVSEGTPISPVMESPEALARWLADNNASAFGDGTATYEQWLRVCRGGYAPSAVSRDGKWMSGVEGVSDDNA